MIQRPLCHLLDQLHQDFLQTLLDLWAQLLQEIHPVQ